MAYLLFSAEKQMLLLGTIYERRYKTKSAGKKSSKQVVACGFAAELFLVEEVPFRLCWSFLVFNHRRKYDDDDNLTRIVISTQCVRRHYASYRIPDDDELRSTFNLNSQKPFDWLRLGVQLLLLYNTRMNMSLFS